MTNQSQPETAPDKALLPEDVQAILDEIEINRKIGADDNFSKFEISVIERALRLALRSPSVEAGAAQVGRRLNQMADNMGGMHAPELRRLAAALVLRPSVDAGAREALDNALDTFRNLPDVTWTDLFKVIDRSSIGFARKWNERLAGLRAALQGATK